MSEFKVPGLSIAFVDSGEIAWTKSYGFSNLVTSKMVSDKTVFTGASLSKPLTAFAALNLVELGKLKLDEDVNATLTSWKVPNNIHTEKEKVTLRQLLGHRAGIKNDLWSSFLPEEEVPSLSQMLAGQTPSIDPPVSVVSLPGAEQQYSNPGYSIIQQLLKDASNDNFDNILDTIVLQPSGMQNSSFQQPMPDKLKKRRAIGYGENLEPYPYRLFPYKAAGGVWTTPSDMAQFVITLFNDYDGKGKILSSSMMKQIMIKENQRLAFSKIFDEDRKGLIFRHYGSNQGFTSYMVGSLDHRQAVIIMTNSDNGFSLLDYIARAVAEFYQWEFLKPVIHKPTESGAEINSYVGDFDYRSEILNFNVKNNALWISSKTLKHPVKLVAVGKSEFISNIGPTKYEFYRPRGVRQGEFKWVRVIPASGRDDEYAPRIKD